MDYITAPPWKENVHAVSGAVAQRRACAHAAHPLSVVQEIYRSAISIETRDRGVSIRGMHGAVWIAP